MPLPYTTARSAFDKDRMGVGMYGVLGFCICLEGLGNFLDFWNGLTTGDLDFWNGLSTGDLDFWNGLTTGDLDFWNGLTTGDLDF